MSTVIALALLWGALSIGVAVVIGRAIRLADERTDYNAEENQP